MLFCALLGLLLLPLVPARADVIMPEDLPPYNEFYEEHMTECAAVEASYIVKGEKEQALVWVPGEARPVDSVAGGSRVYVIAGYDDGSVVWALVESAVDNLPDKTLVVFGGPYLAGWLPMSMLEAEPAQDEPEPAPHKGEAGKIVLVAVMVIVAAGVAVLLILLLARRRSKADKKSKNAPCRGRLFVGYSFSMVGAAHSFARASLSGR